MDQGKKAIVRSKLLRSEWPGGIDAAGPLALRNEAQAYDTLAYLEPRPADRSAAANSTGHPERR